MGTGLEVLLLITSIYGMVQFVFPLYIQSSNTPPDSQTLSIAELNEYDYQNYEQRKKEGKLALKVPWL